MQNRKIRIPVINHKKQFLTRNELQYVGASGFIQRSMLWLAGKVGIITCQPVSKFINYETVELDLCEIERAILEQQANIQHLTDRTAKYVLIGQDFIPKFYDFIRVGTQNFIFYQPLQRSYNGQANSVRLIFDLEVIFVPFMEGCLVLPDLEQLKNG